MKHSEEDLKFVNDGKPLNWEKLQRLQGEVTWDNGIAGGISHTKSKHPREVKPIHEYEENPDYADTGWSTMSKRLMSVPWNESAWHAYEGAPDDPNSAVTHKNGEISYGRKWEDEFHGGEFVLKPGDTRPTTRLARHQNRKYRGARWERARADVLRGYKFDRNGKQIPITNRDVEIASMHKKKYIASRPVTTKGKRLWEEGEFSQKDERGKWTPESDKNASFKMFNKTLEDQQQNAHLWGLGHLYGIPGSNEKSGIAEEAKLKRLQSELKKKALKRKTMPAWAKGFVDVQKDEKPPLDDSPKEKTQLPLDNSPKEKTQPPLDDSPKEKTQPPLDDSPKEPIKIANIPTVSPEYEQKIKDLKDKYKKLKAKNKEEKKTPKTNTLPPLVAHALEKYGSADKFPPSLMEYMQGLHPEIFGAPRVETTHPSVETTHPSVETTHPSVETTRPRVEMTPPPQKFYHGLGGHAYDNRALLENWSKRGR